MNNKFIFLFIALLLANILLISSEPCVLDVSLINQDPYPAIPNDYVKVVFQMTGTSNPECGLISFEVVPSFPFSVEEKEIKKTIKGGTYIKDYSPNWMIPYRLVVNKNALDGDYDLEVKYSSSTSAPFLGKKFRINIENPAADFELHIKDYSYKTNELTIEILNIAETDIEALTLEIPKQDTIEIKGANRVVVGDLDSNEYTTADFEAIPKNGEIQINVLYTDQIGVRRTLTKTVTFDSSYFALSNEDQTSTPVIYYVLLIIVVILIIWFIFRRRKKKQERIMHRRGMAKL